MPSGFPNSIDSFTNPLASSPLNSPSHAVQHQDLNDAVNKIETFMGLVFVKSQVVGTAVSSVTVTNAFSANYDNYFVTYSGGIMSNNTYISLRLDSVATGYYGSFIYADFTGGAPTQVNDNNNNSFVVVGGGNVDSVGMAITILQPFLASVTRVGAIGVHYGTRFGSYAGLENSATSRSEFTIFTGAGTFTGGTIRVYGYRK
jgi:hypothetical protein